MTRRIDPYVASLVVAGALIVGGFVAFAVGWSGAAGTLEVSLQTPYLASAGFGGLGLIVIGVVVAVLQLRRRIGAARARDSADLLAELRGLLEEVGE